MYKNIYFSILRYLKYNTHSKKIYIFKRIIVRSLFIRLIDKLHVLQMLLLHKTKKIFKVVRIPHTREQAVFHSIYKNVPKPKQRVSY